MNSQSAVGLCLPDDGVKGRHYHAWLASVLLFEYSGYRTFMFAVPSAKKLLFRLLGDLLPRSLQTAHTEVLGCPVCLYPGPLPSFVAIHLNRGANHVCSPTWGVVCLLDLKGLSEKTGRLVCCPQLLLGSVIMRTPHRKLTL